MSQYLELVDYRNQVADLYRNVRDSEPSQATWETWRMSRDRVFATHPQSPIEDRDGFASLPFFSHDPAFRTEGFFTAEAGPLVDVANSGAGATDFLRIGSVEFELGAGSHRLGVFWLDGYGGGMFIPFRDRTNGKTTYGGGRYIIDTVKGAYLGRTRNGIILDFNYAYHPSCVHSSRWSCPLAPIENNLDIAVIAGEMDPNAV